MLSNHLLIDFLKRCLVHQSPDLVSYMMVAPKFSSSQPKQVQRTSLIGRFIVYFLVGCSAILLLNSYRLQSVRFEAIIRNAVSTTSRVLPEEDHASSNIGNIGNSEFYVPSLDYRVKGISQYSNNVKAAFEAHVYCDEFEKDLLWEWWRPNDEYGQEEEQVRFLRHKQRKTAKEPSIDIATNETNVTGNQVRTTRKRLLIGVSSGYDGRARLLEQAVWSARVYGALWSGATSSNMDVTVVALQGTAFSPHGCKAPSSHSSIDKIRVLFQAIDSEPRYDRLLLLDTDAMINGMETDLTSLGDNNDDFVVMGRPILTEDGKRDKNKPWEISSGITLWNLEHPLTPIVALDWFNYAKNAIIRGSYQSDQKYLHKALQQYYSTNQYGIVKRDSDREIGIIEILPDNKFDEDSLGKIVKQFVVRKAKTVENKNSNVGANAVENVHDKQIEARLARMEKTSLQICGRYPDACKKVGVPPRYETS